MSKMYEPTTLFTVCPVYRGCNFRERTRHNVARNNLSILFMYFIFNFDYTLICCVCVSLCLCVSLYVALSCSVCVSLYLERSRLRDGIAMLSGILLGHSQTTYRVALEASKLDVTTAVEWILGALYTFHLNGL